MELLLVMVLIGILLGVGGLAIQRMDPGARGFQDTLLAFLESSRDRARASGHPVMLELSLPNEDFSDPGGFSRFVYRPILEATFEQESQRRQGLQLIPPAELGGAGRFGEALDLSDGGTVVVEGRGGQIRTPYGVDMEVHLYSRDGVACQLARWEDFLELSRRQDGSVRLRLHLGQDQDATSLLLDSPAAVLLPERWQHFRFRAAAGRLQIWVNGRAVAEAAYEGPLAEPKGFLELGDPEGRFRGRIDELVLWGRTREPGPPLQEELLVDVQPFQIWFDRFGMLDTQRHPAPIPVEILENGEVVTSFTIGRFAEEYARESEDGP